MSQIAACPRNLLSIAILLSLTTLGIAQNTYSVKELPTLGGTVGSADSINDKGWIAGYANLAGDRTEHAVRWINGAVTDLGRLGGPNSAVGFPAKNNAGMLVGLSQTADNDPLHEQWNQVCGPFESKPVCQGKDLIVLGFVWQNGAIRALPTLGGNKGQAFGINNSGQAVGMAETSQVDPTCAKPQVLDYLGVIWNADGSMQALPPYPGDRISAAVAINDNGQVVGGSGPCATLSPSIGAHALLWQNGTPTDLGNLGGTTNNVAFGINGKGQIVGFSGLSDGSAQAFLYENSGPMQPLGTLPGDVFSLAFSINDSGQVVGESCDANGNCRAFLWQSGSGMLDLNSLVPPGSPRLVIANDINNQGQIVGECYDPVTGNAPAYVAIPQ